jgi:hypothetical protein
MDQQTHFLDQLNRTIKLPADRPEPELWFKELRLLDRSGLMAERRKITLHRGFNILWAEPEDPDTEQGLYRDGLAGHASGKTLFCRILRHLLGEEPFGTQSQRDGIHRNFLSLWAVASVRVSQRNWIVGRPLATGGEKFAVAVDTFEEALPGPNVPVGGYDRFLADVQYLGRSIEPLFPGAGWRHLLPWLARDQEARFSSLVAWREAVSQGDNPLTKVIDRHQVMRAVLGLLDEREPALRQKLESDSATLESMRNTHAANETQLTGKVVLVNDQATELLGEEMPQETEAIVARLDSLVEVLRDGAGGLSKRPPSAAVVAAQKRLNAANKTLTLAESEMEKINDQLPQLKTRRDRDLTIIRQIKTGNVVDPARADANFCPRTLKFARDRGCYQDSKPTEESALSVADLERQAQADAIAITALETRRKKLNGGMSKLQIAVEDAENQLEDATREANRDLTLLTRKAARAEEIARLYRSIAQTKAAQAKAENDIKKRGEALDADKAILARLRRDMEDKVVEISNIFADVIRGVMGASVEPSIRVTGDGIEPHVTRKSELSGAALDTIKTLAFDLAAVIASIEGKGDHPRFLIHDGPREGDMARVIYERFFLYAAGIEKTFASPDEASFQYIITTTTPPPKSMREGSRWLLHPVLDSRKKERRLLREDF